MIDSGNVSVDAGGLASLDGTYRSTPVHLGDARVDASQRLLVLGGTGRAASPTNAPIGGSFYNNPGWFDDLSDGPVSAEVVLEDGTVHAVEPAWVIVAPPDFAPGCGGVVTLYDVMLPGGRRSRPGGGARAPEFWRDVQPMIHRASTLQWVTNDATWPLVSTDWAALSDPSPAAAALRAENAEFVRSVEALLHQTELRDWQRQCLARGRQATSTRRHRPRPIRRRQLTRAALDATVGQGFFPGIEAGIIVTDPQLYLQPFRFRFDQRRGQGGRPHGADGAALAGRLPQVQQRLVAGAASRCRAPGRRRTAAVAAAVDEPCAARPRCDASRRDHASGRHRSQVEVGRDPTL